MSDGCRASAATCRAWGSRGCRTARWQQVAVHALPHPLFDEGGKLLGAVNVFLEAADAVTFLTNEARRYRTLAPLVDVGTADALHELASEHELKARRLRGD